MNCIQPIAPAELGPMLRPKFDSTLLIAASTSHGTPYIAPARCQIETRSGYASCSGSTGALVQSIASEPDRLGVSADGSATSVVGGGAIEVGTTSHVPPARAVPASAERSSATAAAATSLRI